MSIAGHMSFVLFIGAARADASPDQLQRLRTEVVPMLDQFRADGNAKPVLEKVIAVMGTDWQPSGEWAQWLDSMLGASS